METKWLRMYSKFPKRSDFTASTYNRRLGAVVSWQVLVEYAIRFNSSTIWCLWEEGLALCDCHWMACFGTDCEVDTSLVYVTLRFVETLTLLLLYNATAPIYTIIYMTIYVRLWSRTQCKWESSFSYVSISIEAVVGLFSLQSKRVIDLFRVSTDF